MGGEKGEKWEENRNKDDNKRGELREQGRTGTGKNGTRGGRKQVRMGT